MGATKMFSSDSYSIDNNQTSQGFIAPSTRPNPDPKNWEIKKFLEHKYFLLVQINFPDCTNYEGDKILLYEDMTLEKLKAQKLIDPHFSENENYKSPIARFEPTEFGWTLAIRLIESFFIFKIKS